MALISLHEVTLGFGGPPLLDGVSFHLEQGDRVCLIGRNGVGKSSLLRLIAREQQPDSGKVSIGREVRVTYLGQETHRDYEGSSLEYCLVEAQSSVSAEKYLTLLGMETGARFETLSGGEKRRVMLAAALASEADVLLLDEPTNHLDLDTALWLEDYLRRQVRTFIVVTHDRAFAKAVSNRVVDLDRGELFSFDCGFEEFLSRRDAQLASEERQRAEFDKKLAAEEAWLRRGVKARRTRDEGRVRALLRMREAYRERRTRSGSVKVSVDDAGRSGNIVIEVQDLSFSYASGPSVIQGLTTTIMRGDKVGIVGPNGAGKTTLIRLMLKDLEPTSGTVRLGTNLQPLYLDQIRGLLDPEKTVIENLTGGDEMILVRGRSRHVMAYLKDFLFEADRGRSPVATLSGGEQNRLLLAKLFAQPSNLIVMDEPTNDLDMETLELLEDLLAGYAGTVLLVSHDREFLDNVVTDCLVFTPDHRIEEFAGGYSDWRDRRVPTEVASTVSRPSRSRATRPRTSDRKLSFNEARELEALPERIVALEASIAGLQNTLGDPELYRNEGDRVAEIANELSETEERLAQAYERWEELEELSRGAQTPR
ncbi:MAG: ATP-binding cassette domain-containing protein [Spirochaetaceae bacterium]